MIEARDYKDTLSEATPCDLVLTDPPYNLSEVNGEPIQNGFSTRTMDFADQWDAVAVDYAQVAENVSNALRDGGTAIVFLSWRRAGELADAFQRNGLDKLRMIQWRKTNPFPANMHQTYLITAFEFAVVAHKKGGQPTFHGTFDDGLYEFPLCQDEGRWHPTQKPLRLMESIIIKHSNPGDLVCDPFCGSGTTGVAAVKHGRRFVGGDSNKEYAEKASERLRQSARQASIFQGAIE